MENPFDEPSGTNDKITAVAEELPEYDEEAFFVTDFDTLQGEGNKSEKASSSEGTSSDVTSTSLSTTTSSDYEKYSDEELPESKVKWYHIHKVSYYQQYFNVDTNEVMKRLVFGMFPFGENFYSMVLSNPDMYGPFWVTTTCTFLCVLCCSAVCFFLGYAYEDGHNSFDLSKIAVTLAVVFGYLFCVPLILYGALKYFGAKLQYLALVCTYGYSFTIYLPFCILCLIPNKGIIFALLVIASAFSTTSLSITLWPHFRDQLKGLLSIWFLFVVAGFHFSLGSFLNIYTFEL